MRDAGHRTLDAGHRTAKKAKIIYPPPRGVDITRKMFLLTKTKRPKKVHCDIIYSRKRFLKIKTCSAARRSES